MLVKMESQGGGGSVTPNMIYKGSFNSNGAGVSINVTSGKTYIANYNINTDSQISTVTNGDILLNECGAGASWSGQSIYIYVVVFKATSNTISISNGINTAYALTITEIG